MKKARDGGIGKIPRGEMRGSRGAKLADLLAAALFVYV
jgi:hypothetical protein